MQRKITTKELKIKIDELRAYFEKYPPMTSEESSENPLNKLQVIESKLNNQEYKIAVVANMSAGKSTFINSLFGEEVLPAFNHATTDCATFIYSEPEIEQRAIIYFDTSAGREPVEITENLKKEIKLYAQKDEEIQDSRYHNVEKIDLYYPFRSIQNSANDEVDSDNMEHIKIIFIDTPGPNSTGDDYKEKHQDQTRKVLNEANLALFLFDYGQLDANLESDKQGLWHTIKERKDKDKNFEVYFIINKIDMAMNDNFKGANDIKDREEFAQFKKQRWGIHEAKAIEKIQAAAKKHGIENPEIYPVSSFFQLLARDKNQSWDEKDKLDLFRKQHFERLDKTEDEFIDYLGISKLESDMNAYIQKSVGDKVKITAESRIDEVYHRESQRLEEREELLGQPKEEAQENLTKAQHFLNNESHTMRKKMDGEIVRIVRQYTDSIQEIIEERIEQNFTREVDTITKKAIFFARMMANGANNNAAKKATKKADTTNIDLSEKEKVSLDSSTNQKQLAQKVNTHMQGYIVELINECKRDYTNVRSDIKNQYHHFQSDFDECMRAYQDELEKALSRTLHTKTQTFKAPDIDYADTAEIKIKMPESALAYNFQEARYETYEVSTSKWYNPFSWGSSKRVREKVADAESEFTIDCPALKRSINESMKDLIQSFENDEIKEHKDTIEKYKDSSTKLFEDFEDAKREEIRELRNSVKEQEAELQKLKSQWRDLRDLTPHFHKEQ
ncbi:hypothetical protein CQA53_07225 [Helicobacter didelphidarum]|uniref:Dynamin N-terminal domain-containing protein n=1 Tax=Helicobacter didelphidarum TaxID=2040648 RepID=A0A3D8II64_9HELI|nr:dynamin family protein [Helicobacter didelphidarum]RDU64939.1 hypothetical protein CQA53_07225 [Helicobacter didelphidarum]